LAPSPRAAVEGAVAVFSMVTDDAALRAVALGEHGIVAGLGRGAVWAEMSTVSPTVTRELGAVVAARGAAMLDAPVSGSTITVEPAQQWLTMARGLGLGERDLGTLFDVLAGLSGLPPSPNP